jgi:hypothetical protein
VLFEEGDPDQPLIVGSVYNAENMPWFNLPINRKLAGFKSASVQGAANKNYNGIVFNDQKGQEHLAFHSERNLTFNSENDKMFHGGRHKGERVGVANVVTVGKFIPGGGSGGGGGFDEGNPLPEPRPAGILGLNSVVTYGENLQAACPINHQLAIGSNMQLCINPFGLAAGVAGVPIPGVLAAVLGGGMGGNMQFTIGTSATFTLGQVFDISVGPPKIEIHTGYKGHLPVSILCGVLGVAAVVFVLAYDLIKQQYNPPAPDETDPQLAADQATEQTGDKDRATLILVFQLLVDALLIAILQVESLIDKASWFADDAMKKLFVSEDKLLQLWAATRVKPEAEEGGGSWWTSWGDLAFGAIGAVGAVAAEIAVDTTNE